MNTFHFSASASELQVNSLENLDLLWVGFHLALIRNISRTFPWKSIVMVSIQPTQRPPPLFAKLLRLDNPIRSLTVAFWLWKVLLYIVITTCPGLGYDTSTSLLSYADSTIASQSESLSGPLKFTRWDSIYFLDIAEKGYIFEQEWAFGYPRLLAIFVSGIYPLLRPPCGFIVQ